MGKREVILKASKWQFKNLSPAKRTRAHAEDSNLQVIEKAFLSRVLYFFKRKKKKRSIFTALHNQYSEREREMEMKD